MAGKISVQIKGGLGNQLFCFFAGYYAAVKNGYMLELDLNWLTRVSNQTDSDLRSLTLPFENTTQNQSKYFESRVNVTKRRLMESIKYRAPSSKKIFNYVSNEYNDSNLEFDEKLSSLKSGTKLKGHWQTFEYYLRLVENNKVDFVDLANKSETYNQVSQIIEATKNSISLHIRRGDYLSHKNTFGILGAEYYEKSLRWANAINGTVFVFSDDEFEARQLLAHLKGINFHFINYQTTSAEDLMLMAKCKTNIVANSTFSMWGAMLNKTERHIIAPTPQFRDSKLREIQIPGAELIPTKFSD